ncbi:hypothetical protein swp_3602 [Shewanella piezotolerans WP3]|uniref:Uncharacterized protein n=1 Tax=Shewanella piezotolerans (strain WP3 / JCM 13877) TaxID=225849 RepID=B8CQG3_SHEPW|nr:hypothetical protein [Shewanella piezotolerans]ACJ30293.1 hypothetical protein swp_3602 [Shewanella piezotolerans WP3]
MKNITSVSFIFCVSALSALSYSAYSEAKALEGEPEWEAKIASNAELEKLRLELLIKQLEEEEKEKEEANSKD